MVKTNFATKLYTEGKYENIKIHHREMNCEVMNSDKMSGVNNINNFLIFYLFYFSNKLSKSAFFGCL